MWNNGKYIVFLCAVLALNACHTSKKMAETTTPKDLQYAGICEALSKFQPDWQTIDISRMNLNIQFGGQSFSTKGSLKIIRDSVIIISVQPFAGIEMARAQITKDSAVIIDRFNAQYFAENIKSIAPIFEFNFLQSLLSNSFFAQNTDNKDLTKKLFAVYSYPDGCEFRAKNAVAYDFNFFVNKNIQLEKTIITDKTDPYSLTCEYSDFAINGNFEFPNKMKFIVFDGQRPQYAEFSIQKIDFNKTVNASFSIPAKYKKADIKDFKF